MDVVERKFMITSGRQCYPQISEQSTKAVANGGFSFSPNITFSWVNARAVLITHVQKLPDGSDVNWTSVSCPTAVFLTFLRLRLKSDFQFSIFGRTFERIFERPFTVVLCMGGGGGFLGYYLCELLQKKYMRNGRNDFNSKLPHHDRPFHLKGIASSPFYGLPLGVPSSVTVPCHKWQSPRPSFLHGLKCLSLILIIP